MLARPTEGVKHLLIINVIMFAGTYLLLKTVDFRALFSVYFPENPAFQPWQIITHMFMHGGPQHLIFNMLALWMFGTAVEQIYGIKKFLFLYFSCGLGAVFITLLFSYYSFYSTLDVLVSSGSSKTEILNYLIQGYEITAWPKGFRETFIIPMLGASGAIMGILVAFGYLFPETKLMLLFIPFPIKAKYFIPGIILLDLFSAVTGTSIFSPSNTAYIAHLGGAFIGFLIMYYWKKNQFNSNRWN